MQDCREDVFRTGTSPIQITGLIAYKQLVGREESRGCEMDDRSWVVNSC